MTAGEQIYQLIIAPLELFLEAVYRMADILFGKPAYAIFLMSLFMNMLLLPLYKQADRIQADEREAERKLESYVKHIKKTFSGDERFMMLQTYYAQNHYKPYYAMKGLLPLALEIPFFIAAYHFLSNSEELIGASFGPIQNLGSPDGLLVIGTRTINVLPILMTLINVISSAIYLRDSTLKDKITLYGMALIFLVLLYDSPSGLVLYWTLNNLFSLGKNVIYRFRNPGKVLAAGLSFTGAAALYYSLFIFHADLAWHRVLLSAIALMMEIPVIIRLIKKLSNGRMDRIHIQEKTNYGLFLCGGIFLSIVTGVLIPSAVISSSPEEFVQIFDFHVPTVHVLHAALLAAGTFVIWLGVFYYLADKKAKRIFEIVIWVISGTAVLNYMFFGTKLGQLSSQLQFENDKLFPGTVFSSISVPEKTGNIAAIILLSGLFILLFRKKEKLVKAAYYVLILAVVSMSIFNIIQIQSAVPRLEQTVADMKNKEKAHFGLSKNGKNVVVMMMDGAIGSYIPYLLQENPALEEQFRGFTYYPNTLSFGGHTIFASAALYGGYEYTPEEINKRSEELLVNKHNEALRVMPVLFEGAGYDVTVCDPSLAGYAEIPDLSIYDEYPEIQTYHAENGTFLSEEEANYTSQLRNRIWNRNFFCYSMMKISPLVIQPVLYSNGSYLMPNIGDQAVIDLSHASGFNDSFLNSFSVLGSLTGMTDITPEGNHFLMLANEATHEPTLLSEPEYEPAAAVDNTEYDRSHQDRFTWRDRTMEVTQKDHMAHYHVNMAALIKLGAWFDFLRENDVYDNTRIILVADHGFCLNQFEDLLFGRTKEEDVMYYNPLLLVKDFNADGFSTDDSFMTNADVPVLALEALIESPINPFTGREINADRKYSAEQIVMVSEKYGLKANKGTTFAPAIWYSVHDNILDRDNWSKLGEW